MRRTIAIEFVLVLAVLVVTASMSLTTPPRALAETGELEAETADTAFAAALEKQDYRLSVELSPARRGTNVFRVRVTKAGEPFAPVEVQAHWSMPSLGIERSIIELDPKGDGVFERELDNLIVAGNWHLAIEVLVDDFTKVTFETDVEVAD